MSEWCFTPRPPVRFAYKNRRLQRALSAAKLTVSRVIGSTGGVCLWMSLKVSSFLLFLCLSPPRGRQTLDRTALSLWILDPHENHHRDQCNGSCLSIRPAALHRKKINFGHYKQILQPNLFIPAMLKGTVDLYHFILRTGTSTLPGGHEVSVKQNLLASVSPTRHQFLPHFSTDQDRI